LIPKEIDLQVGKGTRKLELSRIKTNNLHGQQKDLEKRDYYTKKEACLAEQYLKLLNFT
jgi:hypothetical protein